MEFLDACRRMVALDSTPGNGTKEVVGFASELCREFGLQVDILEGVHRGNEQANVVARFGEAASEELMLQTHLDTGDPGNYGLWSETGKNPFESVIREGRIYGLGTAKCKLDFLCKLYALKEFKGRSFRCSPVLAGTYGQQVGMPGAVQLVRNGVVNAKFAFVGEPTNLSLVTAGKGVVVVDIRVPFSEEERRFRADHNEMESTSSMSRIFSGRAASTANPTKGENAIEKALTEISQATSPVSVLNVDGGVNVHAVPPQSYVELVEHQLEQPIYRKLGEFLTIIESLRTDFSKYPNMDFDPAISTLNLGLVRTYDDHIFLSANCRLIPVDDSSLYEAWFSKLKELCENIGATFRMSEFKRPFRTDPQQPIVTSAQDVLREMGLSSDLGRQAKSNEANVFSRFGVGCVIFGPGEVEDNAHTPNESVAVEDLDRARRFYRTCIERICI